MKRFLKLLLVAVLLLPHMIEPIGLANATSETTLAIQNPIEKFNDEYRAEVISLESIIVPEIDNGVSGVQEAMIQPFVDDTWELCERQDWVIEDHSPFPIPQSGITLPNRRLTASERAVWIAEYWEMGGPVAFEFEVMRLVNEVRIQNGRSSVEPDRTLGMAARFHAQIMATFGVADNWSHNVGPYGIPGETWGASRIFAEVFGASLGGWTAGNASSGSEIGRAHV